MDCFRLFTGLLENHGSLHINSSILQGEIDSFDPHIRALVEKAGGIGAFLMESRNVELVEAFVCLKKDVIKVQDLAQQHAQGALTQGCTQSSHQPASVSRGHIGNCPKNINKSIFRVEDSPSQQATKVHLMGP